MSLRGGSDHDIRQSDRFAQPPKPIGKRAGKARNDEIDRQNPTAVEMEYGVEPIRQRIGFRACARSPKPRYSVFDLQDRDGRQV